MCSEFSVTGTISQNSVRSPLLPPASISEDMGRTGELKTVAQHLRCLGALPLPVVLGGFRLQEQSSDLTAMILIPQMKNLL